MIEELAMTLMSALLGNTTVSNFATMSQEITLVRVWMDFYFTAMPWNVLT
jgi:hypothetical protein